MVACFGFFIIIFTTTNPIAHVSAWVIIFNLAGEMFGTTMAPRSYPTFIVCSSLSQYPTIPSQTRRLRVIEQDISM
jgi:hypothetical protein